ncbi:MAG: 30S ribosomal protein S8 [candidate division Zixibacteria bacterium RBG_16_53_22]|nr:MAG: 30S ribosomal protein S8 [candidate division Zixibacteria bacterium RBG_16_53_22]
MSMTDTIGDFLTRIRNASGAKQRRITAPASNMRLRVAEVLQRLNYLRSVDFVEDGKQGMLVVKLRYTPDSKSVISGLERISRPGLRVYFDRDKLSARSRKMGTVVLSTSRGLMTDKEAIEAGVGGEALFRVW